MQGDVTGIITADGTTVVTYSYNSWGKLLEVDGSLKLTLGELNPLRYRGYVYDTETALYYLQSRYYDPEIGRFINPDSIELLGANGDFASLNLYAYCGNNPVCRIDATGRWWEWLTAAVTVAVVAVAVVTVTVVTVATFGAGSFAGVAAITAAATMAAKATEVAVLQTKKGLAEEKDSAQIDRDVVGSIYDNGLRIIGLTPFIKIGNITFQHVVMADIEKTFGGTQTLSATLATKGGKLVPYVFVAKAWLDTTISLFADDPVARAEERGYVLR